MYIIFRDNKRTKYVSTNKEVIKQDLKDLVEAPENKEWIKNKCFKIKYFTKDVYNKMLFNEKIQETKEIVLLKSIIIKQNEEISKLKKTIRGIKK